MTRLKPTTLIEENWSSFGGVLNRVEMLVCYVCGNGPIIKGQDDSCCDIPWPPIYPPSWVIIKSTRHYSSGRGYAGPSYDHTNYLPGAIFPTKESTREVIEALNKINFVGFEAVPYVPSSVITLFDPDDTI